MDRPELKCHGQALDLVEACLEQLGIIESTLQVNHLICSNVSGSGPMCVAGVQLGSRPPVGMNHKINRRLLAATPPRPLEIIDTNLAMQRLRKSLQQIGTVCLEEHSVLVECCTSKAGSRMWAGRGPRRSSLHPHRRGRHGLCTPFEP